MIATTSLVANHASADDIYGCTDPWAINYDQDATIDDNSCEYDDLYWWCTDPGALNYDEYATDDDGSCQYDTPPPDEWPVCWNNIVEAWETCDGTDLGGYSCISVGYNSWTLACGQDCQSTNAGWCYNVADCWNGSIETWEICDDGEDNGTPWSCNTMCTGQVAPEVTGFCDTVTDIPKSECQALVNFYNATNGSGWTHSDGWLQSTTVCGDTGWYGVSCSFWYTTNVHYLLLSNNGLSGSIDLSGLPDLNMLVVSYNTITGLHLSGLENLEILHADNNLLTTEQIYNCPVLNYLQLNNNNLTGINVDGVDNLTALYISHNQLTGLSLSGLSKLTYLDAEYNKLTSLSLSGVPNLIRLNLWRNNFTYFELSGLEKLEYIDLGSNLLTGISLSNLPAFKRIYINGNQLTDLDISWVPSIERLDAGINALTHVNFSGCTNLTDMELSQNNFTGFSLAWLENLETLALAYNNLSRIDLSGAFNLHGLYLFSNQLTGIDLHGLPNLEYVGLSYNQLTNIDLTEHTGLLTLAIAHNNFSGDVSFLKDFPNIGEGWGCAISHNYFSVDSITDQDLLDYLNARCIDEGNDERWIDQHRTVDTTLSGGYAVMMSGMSLPYRVGYTNLGPQKAFDTKIAVQVPGDGVQIGSSWWIYNARFWGVFGQTGDICYEDLLNASTWVYAELLEWRAAQMWWMTMEDLVRGIGGMVVNENNWWAKFLSLINLMGTSFADIVWSFGLDITTIDACGSGGIPAYVADIGNITVGGTGLIEIPFTVDTWVVGTGFTFLAETFSENDTHIELLSANRRQSVFASTESTIPYSIGGWTPAPTPDPTPDPNLSNQGGWGWYSPTKDVCPETRDCSSSYYDNICGPCPVKPRKEILPDLLNAHKSPGTGWDIKDSPYSKETNTAYQFAYRIGVTTMPTIQQANVEGKLLRSHLAKMLSVYATEVLEDKPDTTTNCSFVDMKKQSKEMQYYAVVACQLGLMGLNADGTPATKFDPNEEVTRAQFGTTLSRLLYEGENNTSDGTQRYTKHLEALKNADIMKNISTPMMEELRGNVFIMLMRASK